jgi:hypothetical protein
MSLYGYEKSSNKVDDEKEMNETYTTCKEGICVHTPAQNRDVLEPARRVELLTC